jgi:hypothetical protein
MSLENERGDLEIAALKIDAAGPPATAEPD